MPEPPAFDDAEIASAVVATTGLVVGYDPDSPVCPPIEVRLAAGRALAVVGANGTGKSTFLRTVAGLLAPLSGSVELWGRPVDERQAWFRAAVSVVLDEDAWFPALTVAEHLTIVARGHGVPDAEVGVARLVEEFGLAGRADAEPAALSSGQRRRMLLAAGLIRPRRLLILDEPEQRLDAGMRDRLARRLHAEAAAGGTIVFASHDPRLVGALAHTVVLIEESRVRYVEPDEGVAAIEAL